MNHPYGPAANTLGKKENRSPAVRALVVALALAFPGAVAWAAIGTPGTGSRFTTPNGMQVEVTTVNGRHFITKILVPIVSPTGQIQFLQVDTFNGATIVDTPVGGGQAALTIIPAGSTTPLTPEQAQQALQTGTTQSLTASIASGQLPPNTPLPSLMMHWKQTKNAPGYVIKFTDVIITSGTAPSPVGDEKLPGKVGDPIPGTPVGLEGEPGSFKASDTTDADGAFKFAKVPAGNYKLIIDRLPARSVTVGTDGIVSATLRRGKGGEIEISSFSWGVSNIPAPPKSGEAKSETLDQAVGKPVAKTPDTGFGRGNTMGGGFSSGTSPGAMAPPPRRPWPWHWRYGQPHASWRPWRLQTLKRSARIGRNRYWHPC